MSNFRYNRKLKEYQILRWLVYIRDYGICAYCKEKCTMQENKPNGASLDHIIPQAHNGTDTPENLILACRECNTKRRDTPIHEWLQIKKVDPIVIDMRLNKPLDYRLQSKLENMPISKAKNLVLAMF